MSAKYFDPTTKIWSGPDRECPFNVKLGLGGVILSVLSRTPNKIGQINADSGIKLTCAELRLRSIRVAENLRNLGYKEGDRIVMASQNNEHIAPVAFGIWTAGCCVAPFDIEHYSGESFKMLDKVRPKLIICDDGSYKTIKANPEVIKGAKLLKYGKAEDDAKSVEEVLFASVDNEDNYVPPLLSSPETLEAIILASSGTTGSAKGVRLSNAMVLASVSRATKMSEEEIVCTFSSLHWVTGLVALIYATIAGCSRLLTSEPYHPATVTRVVNEHQASVLVMLTYHGLLLVDYLNKTGQSLPSMKLLFLTGATVSKALHEATNRVIPNGKTMIGYGLTEMSGAVSSSAGQKTGAVGHLNEEIKAKILGDNGELLGPNETGEILLKYRYQFLGYTADNQTAIDEDGWMHTGDAGYFDDDGELIYVDRLGDIIKVADLNDSTKVSASELEAVIAKLDGVQESVVVGIPRRSGYESPAALVVRKPDSKITEQDVIEHVSSLSPEGKRLYGGCWFVEKIPRTYLGKIMKRAAKELAVAKSAERER